MINHGITWLPECHSFVFKKNRLAACKNSLNDNQMMYDDVSIYTISIKTC